MQTLNYSNQQAQTLILKSNIRTKNDVRIVDEIFSKIKSIKRWSIDLDDWEHVLKVESRVLSSTNVSVILSRFGYECAELDH